MNIITCLCSRGLQPACFHFSRAPIRILAIVALAMCFLPALVTGSAAAEWRMNRVLLGSRLYDVAFIENGVRIATADGVVTLDAEGKELARHGYDTGISYAILAENGRYGLVRHRPRVPQFTEAITLFDDGETVAEFPIEGTPFLSPNGDWLITTNRYTKTVALYDTRGRLLREDTYPQVQGTSISFSDNNQAVLINLPQGPTTSTTVLYARDGRRLFKIENGIGNANAVLSADGKRAAVIGRAEAVIYSETGPVWRTYPRSNRAGLGMMTRDGQELWLTEGDGLRIIARDTGDSRTIALENENGAVVKLVDEPSGRMILVGQRIERRESGAVWSWRVLDRSSGRELWQGEERRPFGYAALASDAIFVGIDEIEIWYDNDPDEPARTGNLTNHTDHQFGGFNFSTSCRSRWLIEPAGLRFESPAMLTVGYTEAQAEETHETEMYLACYDEARGEWRPAPTRIGDIGSNSTTNNSAKRQPIGTPILICGLVNIILNHWRKSSRKRKTRELIAILLVVCVITVLASRSVYTGYQDYPQERVRYELGFKPLFTEEDIEYIQWALRHGSEEKVYDLFHYVLGERFTRGYRLTAYPRDQWILKKYHLDPLTLYEKVEGGYTRRNTRGTPRGAQTVQILMDFLSDPDYLQFPAVNRGTAIECLGEFRDPITIPLLKRLLSLEPDWENRIQIGRALYFVGEKKPYYDLYDEFLKNGHSIYLICVDLSGDTGARDMLFRTLKYDVSPEEKVISLGLLARLGEKESIREEYQKLVELRKSGTLSERVSLHLQTGLGHIAYSWGERYE